MKPRRAAGGQSGQRDGMTIITYDIDDPAQARSYVADFAPRLLGKEATYVRTNTARLIHFRTMSDEDACQVARWLWAMEQS
jgi:hypothetical protein